jgi:uncharacterized protein (DUF433 family)
VRPDGCHGSATERLGPASVVAVCQTAGVAHVVVDLLDRPVYGFRQVDRVLALGAGTSARWVDGYTRAGRPYDPVVREKRTGSELVTWGEFVEVRLLAEFRGADVPLVRLRPTVQRLRDELGTLYPLATARPWLTVEGREVVRRAQEGLTGRLSFTVVRSGQEQLALDPRVQSFVDSVEWDEKVGFARTLKPLPEVPEVVCDPLRQVGEPTIDGIPVDVIAEQVRVGEPLAGIAEMYGLTLAQVTAAVRYELLRVDRGSEPAAA